VTPGGPEPIELSFTSQAGAVGDIGPLAVGDFGPSPRKDVVSASQSEALLRVSSSNGQGGLESEDTTRFDFVGGFAAIVAADVNVDGQLDVVGSLQEADRVVVALGDGDGSLAEGPNVVRLKPGALVVRELTADAVPDLIVAGPSEISVLRGRGGGSFDPAPIAVLDTGTRAVAMVLMDTTGDGLDDIVAALPDLNNVRIYRNNGDGTFGMGGVRVAERAAALALGDYNGDGRVDLAVAVRTGVAIFLGTPSGLASEPIVSTGGATRTLTKADLNGDGYADLVGIDALTNGARTWIGRGDGTFDTLAPAPFDASGRELVLTNLYTTRLLDAVVSAAGEFELGQNVTPVHFIVGDVNRDGVVNSADLPALFAEIYDGDGSDADSCGGGSVYSNAGADVNGDGLISVADTTALVELLAE